LNLIELIITLFP